MFHLLSWGYIMDKSYMENYLVIHLKPLCVCLLKESMYRQVALPAAINTSGSF